MMNRTLTANALIAFRSTITLGVLGLAVLPSLSGCAILAQVGQAIPDIQPANYRNMKGQTVAVMVWAEDNGVRIDFPNINLDIGRLIAERLKATQAEDKPDQLKNTRFPVPAESVVRFQEDHPDLAAEGIEKLAARLNVSRVIYVELHSFETRPDPAVELYHGSISGSLKVIEVTNGVGRIAYADDSIRVSYPRSSPPEGLPNAGADVAMYEGTLKGFAEEIAKQFAPHADDPDAPYISSREAAAAAAATATP